MNNNNRILDGVKEGWVRPHTDSVFEFARVGEAHSHIEQRKNIGKVILVPMQEDAEEWKMQSST